MHGKLDRHSPHYRDRYDWRYGHRYQGSVLSLYLGLPWYGSTEYRYYESYVPYYVPYTVPVPYVVETELSEPMVVQPESASGAIIPATGEAAEYQLQAERAFREGRYEEAARLSNHAIVEDSQNGRLHLFASQVFFALGDYTSAAAAIQQAAALLDRVEWGFVVEHYQEFYQGEDYVSHMAGLDEYIKQNPDAAYAYFLRGYHFLYLGHEEAARNDLAEAIKLEPRDLLAADLLKAAGGIVPEPPEAESIPSPIGEQPES